MIRRSPGAQAIAHEEINLQQVSITDEALQKANEPCLRLAHILLAESGPGLSAFQMPALQCLAHLIFYIRKTCLGSLYAAGIAGCDPAECLKICLFVQSELGVSASNLKTEMPAPQPLAWASMNLTPGFFATQRRPPD